MILAATYHTCGFKILQKAATWLLQTVKEKHARRKEIHICVISEYQLPLKVKHEAELVRHQALQAPSLFLQLTVSNPYQSMVQTPESGHHDRSQFISPNLRRLTLKMSYIPHKLTHQSIVKHH